MKIKTFSELQRYIEAFNSGHLHLLIVKSAGGLGKTNIVTKSIKDPVVFKGHATPLSIYLKLQENPNSKVVFDDVDTLIHNKTNLALLKQICETTPVKNVYYSSTSQLLNENNSFFPSRNKVILLCNDLKRTGRNMKALLTRGFLIEFEPSVEEIFGVMKTFKIKDQEIYDYLYSIRTHLQHLNFRTYLKAIELKNAGINWRSWIHTEFTKCYELEVYEEIKHKKPEDRNSIWVRETGKSIRTLQRMLRAEFGDATNDTLNGKCVGTNGIYKV